MSSSHRPYSLADQISAHARQAPAEQALTFLKDGECKHAVTLTWGDVDSRARAVAGQLSSYGPAGSRAIVACPSGLDYAVAFYGCMYAGWIPVPAPAPSSPRRDYRLGAIAADAGALLALTTADAMTMAMASSPGVPWVAMDPEHAPDLSGPPKVLGDDVAFLQYTSGSTSEPKGVVVTHRALLAQLASMQVGSGVESGEVIVSWLPLFHDYGLVGHLLLAAFAQAHLVLMSPATMLRRPAAWLETITRYEATVSGGPNFALDLCCRRVSDAERATLDLSSLKTLGCGGEPVHAQTLARFQSLFGPCGLKANALAPAYGMAETVLMVTCHPAGRRPAKPEVLQACAASLALGRLERPFDEESALSLVSCGVPAKGVELRIINPKTRHECPDGTVGEIWVGGNTVTAGYWKRPEESRAVFGATKANGSGPWFRTGDLGVMSHGSLYITGRSKEVIIVRGHNHYPTDIERSAQESHSALEPGAGAAFGVTVDGEERVVLVQEVSRHARRVIDVEAATSAIKEAVSRLHGIVLHDVVIVDPLTVPKTSSGKVQRVLCRDQWATDQLDRIGVVELLHAA